MSEKKFYVIGVMSGTSLDGLDLAYCGFSKKKAGWSYKIKRSVTITYHLEWKTKLSNAHSLSGEELMNLHAEYGRWIGGKIRRFIIRNKITRLDFIASHGHTVFHQTRQRFTFQLGDGNAIFAKTGIPVIFDFRSLDVQLGGQGAPLVPVGDRHLFRSFDVCLNLGGIANLSMEKGKTRIAFDVCFVNMGLNFLSSSIGLNYDRDGSIARKGNVNSDLLNQIILFYKKYKRNRPSLAREDFESGLMRLLTSNQISLEDKFRTFCESVAIEIREALGNKKKVKMLVTGGGAKNKFLMEVIASKLKGKTAMVIPDEQTIEFKEAVVFAFLGVLKSIGKVNVLKSVTRARRNSSSGVVVGKL